MCNSAIRSTTAAVIALVVRASCGLSQTPSLTEALDAGHSVWMTGGDANWFGQTVTTHDGVDAAQSGPTSFGQQTWMETTVTGPVILSFWRKVASEPDYAYLDFSIDEIVRQGWVSGTVDWENVFFYIGSGTHTCRWTFVNHSLDTAATNAVWVDDVQLLTPPPPKTRYVWTNSPAPSAPFTNWATAAHVIQEAIDAATDGDTVLVTNGVYNTGGAAVNGAITNRVAITNAVQVLSVNGPAVTIIRGSGPVGSGAIRGAYVGRDGIVSGFTITNGATLDLGDVWNEESGGGVWCESGGLVSNCKITGNAASWWGGGCIGGTYRQCVISDNVADFSGGGAAGATLENCVLLRNTAESGGGSRYGHLYNCLLIDNSADDGGGADSATLNHCTLTGNSAVFAGGGALGGTLNNCIAYYNTAARDENTSESTLSFSCSTPDPGGAGNITNAPQLVSAGRIAVSSPCVGRADAATTSGVDIDGDPLALATLDRRRRALRKFRGIACGVDHIIVHDCFSGVRPSADRAHRRSGHVQCLGFRRRVSTHQPGLYHPCVGDHRRLFRGVEGLERRPSRRRVRNVDDTRGGVPDALC